jgi:hypothetical protein
MNAGILASSSAGFEPYADSLTYRDEPDPTTRRKLSLSKVPSAKTVLRRVSLPASIRRSSKSAESTLERQITEEERTPPAVVGLLLLPIELLSQILARLPIKDLCTFRLLSRSIHHIVTSGEIPRRWINTNISASLVRLYPPPQPVTFTYLGGLHKRHRLTERTTDWYVNFIERYVVRHSLLRHNPWMRDVMLHAQFHGVASEMRIAIFPLLLVFQHYFESCATVLCDLVTTVGGAPHDSDTIKDAYLLREREIITQYKPSFLLEMYQMWCFMTWSNNQLLNQPSYAGLLERTIRGWISDPIESCNLNLAMILGGLRTCRETLGLRTYKDRRNAVERRLKGLDPGSSTKWAAAWAEMRFQIISGAEEVVTKEQAKAVLEMKLVGGNVFGDSARAVLVEKGLLPVDVSTDVGTVQQCTAFLVNIAGYDVLHTLPSMRPSLRREGRQEGVDNEYTIREERRCERCEEEGHDSAECPNVR